MAKEKKTIHRLAPCPNYDVERLESWLQDMAKEGWLLSKDAIWTFTFEKSAPQAMRYRLEPKKKVHTDYTNAPDDDEVDLFREYGWEFVTQFDSFYIYSTADPHARELNTDYAVQAAALKSMKRSTTGSLVTQLFCLFYWIPKYVNEFYRFLVTFDWPYLALFVILLVSAVIYNCNRFYHIYKLRKQLKNNVPLDHNKPWKKDAPRHRVSYVLEAAVIVLFFTLAFSSCTVNFLQEDTPTAEYPGDPPFVTMADILPGSIYTAEKFSSYNTYKSYSTSMSPTIIEWREFGKIVTSDGKIIDGSLSIDYYETVSPTLARGLVDDFLYYYQKYDDFQIIDGPEIDADYVVTFQFIYPTILIQKDNIFISARVGLEYQEEYLLEEWAFQMAEYLNK